MKTTFVIFLLAFLFITTPDAQVTFTDATQSAGVANTVGNQTRLGTNLAWGDFDGDGDLGAIGLRAGVLACGYAASLAILAQLRQRLAGCDAPEPFRDTPLMLITLGIVALALYGFSGMHIP